MKNRTRAPFHRLAPALPAIAILACLALLLASSAAPAAARSRYEQGDRVEVTGLVTDPQGRPLPGVRVILEATRNTFSLREMRRVSQEARRVSAVTDSAGQYRLVWPWDSYFNRFELLAGIPVRKGSTEKLHVLERSDVTQRVLAGSPVVSAVVVEDRELIDKLRAFLASIESDDEQKIYQQMGKPDRVERVKYPDHAEVSWWYFGAGKVYRFRDGRLQQIVPFDPVPGS